MKTIKKVAVTPVTPNTGDIIDSFSTLDDKTTNAPSINAVENYAYSKSEKNSEFNTQTYTFSTTNQDQTITVNFTFRRSGNVVMIVAKSTDMPIGSGYPFTKVISDLPDWAKISETPSSNMTITSDFGVDGGVASNDTGGIFAFERYGSISFVKQANGNYSIGGVVSNSNGSENVGSVTMHASYIVW